MSAWLTLYSVDYEVWDDNGPCPNCPEWFFCAAWDARGRPVRREWHRPACPTYVQWADDSSTSTTLDTIGPDDAGPTA